MHIFEQLINSLAPHRCISCLREGSLLCDPCSASVKLPPAVCYKCGETTTLRVCSACRKLTNISRIYAAAHYSDIAKELVHRLKFERARAAGDVIARLIHRRLPNSIASSTILCPIPTANRRVRQRGYDQAVLVARRLRHLQQLTCRELLVRVKATRQVGRGRQQRHDQLVNAFQLTAAVPSLNTPILLVDDVLTTGSTIESAATVLSQAGFRNITVAVFAIAALSAEQ